MRRNRTVFMTGFVLGMGLSIVYIVVVGVGPTFGPTPFWTNMFNLLVWPGGWTGGALWSSFLTRSSYGVLLAEVVGIAVNGLVYGVLVLLGANIARAGSRRTVSPPPN